MHYIAFLERARLRMLEDEHYNAAATKRLRVAIELMRKWKQVTHGTD